MEAIILAGGLGTRLRKVISDIPKPMAPVNGKPFLEYILHWLVRYPVTRILISSGYKADTISEYFGNSYKGIPISYIVENKPLGTGGAIKYAMSNVSGNDVLILNGDTFFPVDIDHLQLIHKQSGAQVTIALKKMFEFDRYGTVEINDDRIVSFNEKKHCSEGLINGGLYIVERGFIETLDLPETFSFEKEVLEKIADSEALMGLVFNEVFIDIGIPEEYHRAGSVLNSWLNE